jgi:hypothetical protein
MKQFRQTVGAIVFWSGMAGSAGAASDVVRCEGDYQYHLQGVAAAEGGDLYWSFTTELVKTDAAGRVLTKIEVENHHGDLCVENGRIYLAVNLGEFNEPAGKADSWVYVYDEETLQFLARHEVPQVVHGAGGIAAKDGRFFVVGGLPAGVEENYVYEYDADFGFVQRNVIASGWTSMGIQTIAWHDGAWWFGCYGDTRTLLKTDASFRLRGHFAFDCSLGIVGVAPDRFLVADGPKTPEGRCLGEVRVMRSDPLKGLVAFP